MLKAGELAPDFVLPDCEGREVRLSDFEGRKTILWFYPKADTQTVTAEAVGFRDLMAKFEEHNAVVLGISVDSTADNAAFAAKYGLSFSLLSDLDREMSIVYGAVISQDDAVTKRLTYVIDEDGHIVRSIVRVKTDGHADEVLAIVQQLP